MLAVVRYNDRMKHLKSSKSLPSIAMQQIMIPGEIPSKKNSYVRLNNGRVVKPMKITDFEKLVEQCVMAYALREMKGEFSMKIKIYTKTNRCDVDNMATTIIDALQDAGVYKNDKKLVSYCASKERVSQVQQAGAKVQILEGSLTF